MSQASIKGISDTRLWTVTRDDCEHLADRLFSRSVSKLATCTDRERQDMLMASRVIRRLLQSYEKAVGRQLVAIMLDGGQVP